MLLHAIDMFTKDTHALLQKSLEALPTLVGGGSLRFDIDELVAEVLPPSRIAIVDDSNTAEAFGDHVFKALKSRFSATHITLKAGTSATSEACDEIAQRAHGCDAYVAVGSGTISDLCKYVSHKENKPYLVFPTAASMNGYVSANASISEDGYKQTLPAHMPKAVFCDFSVIAAAPARLSKSGLGDCLARPTAQTDWLMSHLLLDTSYNETPFTLLEPLEAQLFDSARGVASGDMASIECLMQLLLLSGFGMTIAGGSYPASQGEHMIAHTYEMLAQHRTMGNPLPPLHGEEIGVTSLAMAHLQQRILTSKPRLQELSFPMEGIAAEFGSHTATQAKKAYWKKREHIEEARLDQGAIVSRWDEIASKLEKILLSPAKIESILKAASAPTQIEHLKWDTTLYGTATAHARFLRDRFTFLDLI
jgi:glycerol-1-phosphate dehydrogenase [NAD(P)+]